MKTVLTMLVCLLVLAGGAAATWYILETEPTAQREGAVRQSAMLVEVVEASVGSHRPEIVVLGEVEPAREIHVRPLVGGEIVHRAPVFTPGGLASAGDVLVRIDAADYENTLAQRRSELAQAEADLAIESGRQIVAKRDLDMLDASSRPDDTGLALREPQRNAARARVQSAEAAVRQAELEVSRTVLTAPFDAHVLTRNTDVGTQVDPGDELGHIVCVDEYWVVAAVPQSMLRWLRFPDEAGSTGSRVRIRNRAAWTEGTYREGTVHRLIGALDQTTRMARVLVVVRDPLALEPDAAGLPPMLVGSVVQARIEGRPLEGVIRVHRDHLRTGDIVWTMVEDKLVRRKVEIAFQDAEYAYVSDGLEPGALVVTTNLSTDVEGARLRTAPETAVESGTEDGADESPEGGAE